MQAQVLSAEKVLMPNGRNEDGTDRDSVMVVVSVKFSLDDGTLYHTQKYAFTPDHVPQDGFRSQAAAMQADLDRSTVQAPVDEQSKLADEQVENLQKLTTKEHE
jgi:hypothetical protein